MANEVEQRYSNSILNEDSISLFRAAVLPTISIVKFTAYDCSGSNGVHVRNIYRLNKNEWSTIKYEKSWFETRVEEVVKGY